MNEVVKSLADLRHLQVEHPFKHLVDIDRVIQESFDVIDQQFRRQPDEAGSMRRDPLVFSRLARGGKTTVLTRLFDKLKEKGYSVMIVSFNGASGFIRQSHETAEIAIMRQIVRQLIDPTAFSEDELQGLECDERVLNTFLDQQTHFDTPSQISFIILIDELNLLGAPLSPAASTLLQRLFLRKNRYLVFSTHIPFTLSADGALCPITVSSTTDLKVVRMPQ